MRILGSLCTTPLVLFAFACTEPDRPDEGPRTSGDPTKEPFVGQDLLQPLWLVSEAGQDLLQEPNELTFDPFGRLWAGDVERFVVDVFADDGTWIDTLGGEGDEDGQFLRPSDDRKFGPESIYVNEFQAFVVDRGGRRIHVYDTESLSWIRTITNPRLEDPTGLVIDSQENLYVADQYLNVILKLTPEGDYIQTFQTRDSSGRPILKKTETLALIEDQDLLFATSEDASTIEVFFLSTGEYANVSIGSIQTGPVPQDGRYRDDIEGIAVDINSRWLYTSDEDNGRVMVHDLDNVDALFAPGENFGFTTDFGTRGDLPGQLRSADGIAVAADGRIAIADQGNHRLQVFDAEMVHSLDLD
jgi:sugar lactone lactonase YvrE